MTKRTLGGTKKKAVNLYGFRKRMKCRQGRNLINRRRKKCRKKLSF